MINLKKDKGLQSLYQKMKGSVIDYGFNIDELDLRVFTARVGANYPVEPGKGILFYGRATNGWDDDDKKNDDLCLVYENNSSSPFFNLLYYLSWEFYGDSWCSKIAWSNICKIAPNGGNPSDSLWRAQKNSLSAIIQREVELLSPELIVLITGNTVVHYSDPWHSPFFTAFPDLKEIRDIKWSESNGKDCTATLYANGKIKVLLTDRPEFRPIEQHAAALKELFEGDRVVD